MKITFLGSGHGIPSAVRYCNSILVTVGQNRYLFDTGAPVIDLFLRKGYSLPSLKTVCFTHLHGDHVNGFFNLIDLACWAFTDMRFTTYSPEERFLPLIRDYVELSELRAIPEDRLPLKVYEKGLVFEDDRLRVTAVPTSHAKGILSYGFLLEAEGKRVYLTGDMSRDLTDFPVKEAAGADLLVTELAHCAPETLLKKIEETAPVRTVLNHVYPVEKIDAVLARKEETASELIVAEDGTEIEL